MAIRRATEPHLRSAILGALLGSATASTPVITGGSAIAIRTEGRFVTRDLDLIGARSKLAPVLERWGFTQVTGRSRRSYWSRDDLGLFVDIIDRPDYPGLGSGVLTFDTPFGPVAVAAAEDLILRRLVYWRQGGKEGSTPEELMEQAVSLFVDSQGALDLAYLDIQVRYERAEEALGELKRLAALVSGSA